jgi:nicotinamide-nucleotide amidase
MFPTDLLTRAEALLAAYRARGWKIATAESCTGGLVAALLTEIPGSSDVVERGFVTYSNDAKMACLGVPAGALAQYGAVSEIVARAMAEGAIEASLAHAAVAITGVAGPGGGSDAKPVGLVHLAVATRGGATVHREMRFGDIGRGPIRSASVATALELLEGALKPA